MDDPEDVQLSPVAVTDNDFISNEDIAFALQHLHLEELLLPPEEDDISIPATAEIPPNDDLLRVFDDDDEKYHQETNDLGPEFENLAEQFDSLALDDDDPFLFEMNDTTSDAMLYCQPCNDPDSIPPFSEDAIATAAALLAEEYEQIAERENDTFWKEQLEILENEETPPQGLTPPEEDWKEEDDWIPDPIPLPEVAQKKAAQRPEAVAAAKPILEAFDVGLWQDEQDEDGSKRTDESTLRECLGHKERILGCAISPDGKYLASASQDGTVRIWDMASHKELRVLSGKSKEEEMLRVAWYGTEYLAMGGADGWVRVFHCDDWSLAASIDHDAHLKPTRTSPGKLETVKEEEEGKGDAEAKTDEEKAEDSLGPPQIYSLQFVDEFKGLSSATIEDEDSIDSVFVLTSADDFVILWELDATNKKSKTEDGSRQILQPREIFSLRFSAISAVGYGVSLCHITRGNVQSVDASLSASDSFGGARNPNNIIFVFDASYCPTNGLIGAALSDGTLRLMNSRGVCRSILSLPGCQSHLTSFSWDSTGKKLATAVATGHVIVWSIEQLENETIQRTCDCILQGGHIPGRPVFGARFLQNDELLVTWGSDGRLCLWDGKATEEIDAPMSLLLEKECYPIYGVDISTDPGADATIAIAGGGSIGGFLGIPVYLKDISALATVCQDDTSTSKRSKTSGQYLEKQQICS